MTPSNFRNLKKTMGAAWLMIGLAAAFMFTLPQPVFASSASLYLFPQSGSYEVGGSFSVTVKIDSGQDSINAAEATLIFNPREIQVISVSKTNSIFTLWTADPAFSNTAGTITFGGGLTKGFNGPSGDAIAIRFKAVSNATAKVNFSSGSILANDGSGTNVLSRMLGGSYVFSPAIVVPPNDQIPGESETPPASRIGVPLAPVITSQTHPDPDQWYANNMPQFSWEIPNSITDVRVGLDQHPVSVPNENYSSDNATTSTAGLDNGVWYFHIQFKNSAGWGSILHRKVMIDMLRPENFEIVVDNEGDPTNPRPLLKFGTKDTVSGIDFYELKIDQGDPVRLTPQEIKNGYRLDSLPAGTHSAIVGAFDFAANRATTARDIRIESIEPPVITELPVSLREDEILIVRGSSKFPHGIIRVTLKNDGEDPIITEVQSDTQGSWSFVPSKTLRRGTYQISARVSDLRGAQSFESEKITFAVLPPVFVRVGKFVYDYLGTILLVIALIGMIIIMIFSLILVLARIRRKILSRTNKLSQKLYIAFENLRKVVREQTESLDGAPGLSESEGEVHDKLKEALDNSEKFLNEEIKNIEKELK